MYILVVLLFAITKADQLLSVQVIWRHGARNPYYCNWKCEELKEEMEKLTGTGMRQLYILGHWLRKKYVDTGFISPLFDENQVYFESTTSNRSLMSAYSMLQGLYPSGPDVPLVDENYLLPPNKGSVKPIDIGTSALPNKIAVIPIHSKEEGHDYALYVYCPNFGKIEDQNIKTEYFKNINQTEKVKNLLQDFNTQMKPTTEVTNIIELNQWRDTFTCTRFNGQGVPAELKAETLQEMDKITGLGFTLRFLQNDHQSKLFSTPFFQYILSNFDDIISGKSKHKFRAYSAHDTTIQSIKAGLNLTSAECIRQWYFGEEVSANTCLYQYPDFASNLVFELYNSSLGKLYVKVMHNGTYENICLGGGKTCLYHTFNSTLHAQMVDYKGECGFASEDSIEIKTPGWAIAFFVILIVLFGLMISMVVILHRKKQQNFMKIEEDV